MIARFRNAAMVSILTKRYCRAVAGDEGTYGEILRDARRRAGMSQRALAERAGITQSVVSAYERGRREPALSTLRKLVAATGSRLQVTAVPHTAARESPRDTASRGQLGSLVAERRHDLLEVAARHGIRNIRVFGSAARGDDGTDSDVDLLVTVPRGMGLLGLARVRRELEGVLGVSVDVVPDDGLKPHIRRRVSADAVPL